MKTNLIESWLAVVLVPGMTIAQAIRDLNAALGTRYTPQDFGKWRRAARPIPQHVTDHMLLKTTDWAVSQEIMPDLCLHTEAMNRIAARLTPPKRSNKNEH